MSQRRRWREELVYEIKELTAQAVALRDAFVDPVLKRQLTNVLIDLSTFDNLIRDRDDLLALLVTQKAEEIRVLRVVLDAYPPHGPHSVPAPE